MNFIKDCITFFQAGGVFMYPLAACSVLLIAAIIYRMFNMKRSTICPARLTRAVEQYTRGALERSELERMAADSDSVEGRLVLDALNSPLEDEAALKEMIQVKAREEFAPGGASPAGHDCDDRPHVRYSGDCQRPGADFQRFRDG